MNVDRVLIDVPGRIGSPVPSLFLSTSSEPFQGSSGLFTETYNISQKATILKLRSDVRLVDADKEVCFPVKSRAKNISSETITDVDCSPNMIMEF